MKKPDLSRLVTLHLSPSEAATVAGVLEAVLRLDEIMQVDDRPVIEGAVKHLMKQLQQLEWPQTCTEPKKAPYSV